MRFWRRGKEQEPKTERQDNTTFGGQLQTLRERAGMSERQFASASGITVSYLRKIESGERTPRREQVIKMCQILGLDRDRYNLRNELLVQAGYAPIEPSDLTYDEGGVFNPLLEDSGVPAAKKADFRKLVDGFGRRSGRYLPSYLTNSQAPPQSPLLFSRANRSASLNFSWYLTSGG